MSGLISLRHFMDLRLEKKGLLEQTVNLAQYPEDRNQKNRDYEQQ